jgi:hypothetical protein
MPSSPTAIGVVPIVDPHVEESAKYRSLHWLGDPDDLSMMGANRETKQGVAMIAWPQVVTLRTVATHPRYYVRYGQVWVAEFDPTMLVDAMIILGNGSMTPDS